MYTLSSSTRFFNIRKYKILPKFIAHLTKMVTVRNFKLNATVTFQTQTFNTAKHVYDDSERKKESLHAVQQHVPESKPTFYNHSYLTVLPSHTVFTKEHTKDIYL